MTTDLVLHTLAVEGASAEPTGLVFPDGTGEVAPLDDPEAVSRWYRAVLDLEQEALRPAKRVAADALYQEMDSTGSWTLHLGDLEVSGESAATWQDATVVDGAGLYDDLLTLRMRDGDSRDDAAKWIAELCRVEISFTASGRNRLQKMAGPYREALLEHTTPTERARKAPTVRRAK